MTLNVYADVIPEDDTSAVDVFTRAAGRMNMLRIERQDLESAVAHLQALGWILRRIP